MLPEHQYLLFALVSQRSMRNSCVQQLQVDTYVAAILEALKGQPDISEVDIGPDGRWRPAGELVGMTYSWQHVLSCWPVMPFSYLCQAPHCLLPVFTLCGTYSYRLSSISVLASAHPH
jgi:hypothetical protein